MSRPPKYPWQLWWASTEPVHVQCADYDVQPSIFQIAALNQARKDGERISTRSCRNREHMPCIVISRQRRNRINWDVVLDGRSHEISYDLLRPTQPDSFIAYARAQAAKRGLSLKVDRRQSELYMVIEARPKGLTTDAALGESILAKYRR